MNAGITTTILALLLAAAAALAEDPYQVAWTAQIGTNSGDESWSVAVDGSGNAYISGCTYGDLGGPNAGLTDAFLSKFDLAGNELWTRQIGTSGYDSSRSVAVDASGDVYISGETYGDLDGANAGLYDAFLSKFDPSGNEVWTRQIGTSGWDQSWSVAVDASGDVYISGLTYGDLGGPNAGSLDAFLSKFDPSGNEVWTTQIGTGADDISRSVAVDAAGDVYISGLTYGDLGGPSAGSLDAFLSKFDSSGNELWTTQIGTSGWDQSFSVAVDASGDVYISGSTSGDLGGPSAGGSDAFLSKFDPSGNEVWTTQIGTSDGDSSVSIAVDASGDVYISGSTSGDLGGPSAGYEEAFLSKFDSSGNDLWTRQIGTRGWDESYSVAVDASGDVYISGRTDGDLCGLSAGSWDAFLVKYEVPEPATLFVMGCGAAGILRRRRRA